MCSASRPRPRIRVEGQVIAWDGASTAVQSRINSFASLNDVATAHYIKGKIFAEQGNTTAAMKEFSAIVKDYSNAQAWDPQNGFWSLSEAVFKDYGSLFAATNSVAVTQDADGWKWVVDGKERGGMAGIVYQPVPDGMHIAQFEENYAALYKSLLDVADGGKGDAAKLKEMGVEAIRVYELSTTNAADIQAVKEIFTKVHDQYGLNVMVGTNLGLYDAGYASYTPERQASIIADTQKLVQSYAWSVLVPGAAVGQ